MEQNQELIVPRGVSNFIQLDATRKEKIANFSRSLAKFTGENKKH